MQIGVAYRKVEIGEVVKVQAACLHPSTQWRCHTSVNSLLMVTLVKLYSVYTVAAQYTSYRSSQQNMALASMDDSVYCSATPVFIYFNIYNSRQQTFCNLLYYAPVGVNSFLRVPHTQ